MSDGPIPTRIGLTRPLLTSESSDGATAGGDDLDWDTGPIGSEPSVKDQWKQPCRVATTASITISTALNNADTLDGVTLATGDRVLVKDQGTASQNGIYIVGATPVRAPDMDDDDEVVGAWVYVIAGTANSGKVFKNTNTTVPTIDTTSLTFVEFSATASFGTPANTYGTPAAGAASTGVRTDAVLPGPPIVILTLTNKSGGSVAAGDVVVIDTSNNTAFTTTTTGQAEVSVGIAQATIASNASGAVLVAGFAALVNVPASVTRGHYVETHTVVKQATGSATRRAGSFGQFLTGGTTPTAWLWGQTDQTASGSTSFGTPALTLSTSNSAGAASTAIRTDATILVFDATTPATQAFGDAGTVGSAGTTAHRDHKHPMPTAAVTTSGLTQATGKLLGRNTASTGAIEEITLGTNLSMTGTTLNATAGAGGITQSYSGYNTIGGSNEVWGASTTRLKLITLASDGFLASIDFYLDQNANNVNSNIAVGVWTDSTTTPSLLIAAPAGSAQIQFMGQPPGTYTYTPRWVAVPISVWLPAGTYWIGGGMAVGTSMRIYYDGSGSDVKWTWSAGAQLADGQRFTNTVTTQKFSIRGSILR